MPWRLRCAAERALALDPNLSDAHRAKATIYRMLDWDWEAAAAEDQKAYNLDPTDAEHTARLGYTLWILHGASDNAFALLQKAIELDPVNADCYAALGAYYTGTGRLPEAETAYRKALDLLPTYPQNYLGLGVLLLLRGEAAAALADFQ